MRRFFVLIGGSGFSLGLWPPFRKEVDRFAESWAVDINLYPEDRFR